MNTFAQQAINQLEVTPKNRIIYRMIPQVIQTEDDLSQLHSLLIGRTNKIHTVLCSMIKRKSA